MFAWKNANEAKFEDSGKLLLRIAIAGMMLLHGIAKLMHGVGGIQGMLAGYGLPEFLAYGVIIGEIVAPLIILIGYYTRIAAIIFAVNMVVAIGLAHPGDVLSLGPQGGWAIELPMLYLFGAVVIAMIGPGRYALRHGKGWFA